jgi:hypothetical protein
MPYAPGVSNKATTAATAFQVGDATTLVGEGGEHGTRIDRPHGGPVERGAKQVHHCLRGDQPLLLGDEHRWVSQRVPSQRDAHIACVAALASPERGGVEQRRQIRIAGNMRVGLRGLVAEMASERGHGGFQLRAG